jgi:hypothetical protein
MYIFFGTIGSSKGNIISMEVEDKKKNHYLGYRLPTESQEPLKYSKSSQNLDAISRQG